nr:MAG TPA: hypothetical protein [Caudoviricetes sp.]
MLIYRSKEPVFLIVGDKLVTKIYINCLLRALLCSKVQNLFEIAIKLKGGSFFSHV